MDPIQTSDLQPENRAIEHSTNVPAPSSSGVTQVVVATLAMAFVVVVSHVMFAPAPVVTSHSAPPMRSSTSSQMAMSSSSLHAAAQPARKKLPPMSRPPHRVAVTKTPVRPSTQRASSTSSVSFVDASSEPSHVAAEEPYVFQVSLPTDLVVSFISKPVDPRQRVGVYLTASSMADDDMRQYTIKELLAAGGDTLVFDVKGSAVYFHSAAPLATQLNLVKPAYDLPAIIREAHENGIYVIGRFVAIKDMSLSGALPETQIRHPVTEKSVGSTWVDPAHPTVITYNMEILRELVASGIDEVNFDYIRYPTEYYPDITTIGLTGQQKADHLVEFLKAARAVVDEYGSSTVLGVSTYAIIGWDFAKNVESVGQDIALRALRGYRLSDGVPRNLCDQRLLRPRAGPGQPHVLPRVSHAPGI